MEKMVLVADDSVEWREAFCEYLRHRGLRAEGVGTGAELSHTLRKRPDTYAVLVVDNSMPESEGDEELPYCGIKAIHDLRKHLNSTGNVPSALDKVIIRSIYSREDIRDIMPDAASCSLKTAEWFDRNVTLDELMRSITRLLSGENSD